MNKHVKLSRNSQKDIVARKNFLYKLSIIHSISGAGKIRLTGTDIEYEDYFKGICIPVLI